MNNPIARMGEPILYERAKEVINQNEPDNRQIITDLIATFNKSKATGLAAPQIFKPLRIIVFHATSEQAAKHQHNEEIPFTVLINPSIEPLTNEMGMTWESCLSIPGMIGEVPRYKYIRYEGFTIEGEHLVREAHGFHAYVVQHEYDHLEGVIYPMRMKNLIKFGFVDVFEEILTKEFLDEFR